MSNLAVIEPGRRSVLVDMAANYGMEPQPFEATLRATVFPANASKEQFAAFLLVAKQYSLNPLLKEIYAFPAKGGGIVPIVSIDGWMNLINSHPKFDGMEFEEAHGPGDKLVSVKCTIYRKDRSHPVSITEYLHECKRPTEPWKMEHRMLRHKAAIQCARYAFGFAGIYDEDEGERIAEVREVKNITPPPPPPRAPALEPPRAETAVAPPPPVEERKEDAQEEPQALAPPPPAPRSATPSAPTAQPEPPQAPQATKKLVGYGQGAVAFLEGFAAECATARDSDELVELWVARIDGIADDMLPPDYEEAAAIYHKNEARFAP